MRKPEHPAHDIQDTVGAAAARARVWASPGVRSAVGWAVTALEEGVESASPKVRKTLQRIARDLAQTVESTSPDLQRGLERISPALGRAVDLKRAGKTAAEASRRAARRIEHPKHGMRTPTKAWLIAGVLAGSALVGATLGRLPRRPGTPAGRLGAEAESKAPQRPRQAAGHRCPIASKAAGTVTEVKSQAPGLLADVKDPARTEVA